MQWIKSVAAGLIAFSLASQASAESVLLYDAAFDVDTSGQPPAVDQGAFPRHAPSLLAVIPPGGVPIVQDHEFLMSPNDQIWFEMPQEFWRTGVRLDVDLLLHPNSSDPNSYWRILFDTPSVQTITFDRDGTIDIFNAPHYSSYDPVARPDLTFADVATYPIDERFHLTILTRPDGLDLPWPDTGQTGDWSIFVDSQLVWHGPFFAWPEVFALPTIRFAQLWVAPEGQSALIDNVRISFVPEPDPRLLVVLVLVAARKRRRKAA